MQSILPRLKEAYRTLPVVRRVHDRERMRRRYATEIALIEGRHQTTCQHPSILHFSFNKAGTQYVKSLLGRCAVEHGITPVHFSDHAYNSDFPFLDRLSPERVAELAHIFRPNGYCYTPFGGMIDGVRDLGLYRVVLVVRDPRDVLVSEFYSNAYSHMPPLNSPAKLKKFKAKRAYALDVGIDRYALSECDRIRREYTRYEDLLLARHSHVHLSRYERMVHCFDGWLGELLQYCELPVSHELREILLKEHEATKPAREDPNRHLRKGLPGDYREKLATETIAALNGVFAETLSRYGYEPMGAPETGQLRVGETGLSQDPQR